MIPRRKCSCGIKLEFHGARGVTSDGGLLAYRKLDDALGLTATAITKVLDGPHGKNTRHKLSGLFPQAVFGRLAGYEDVNDAERLARDPAMCAIVGRDEFDRAAASSSQMGRFETGWLATDANLAALTDLSGTWIDRVHARKARTRSAGRGCPAMPSGTTLYGSTACARYDLANFLRMLALPEQGRASVAEHPAREARQDRRPDRPPRLLRRVPTGRGSGATRPVRRDPPPDRSLAGRGRRCSQHEHREQGPTTTRPARCVPVRPGTPPRRPKRRSRAQWEFLGLSVNCFTPGDRQAPISLRCLEPRHMGDLGLWTRHHKSMIRVARLLGWTLALRPWKGTACWL